MAEETNPIEIANKSSVSLGDLVVIDAQTVAPIVRLEEATFLAQKGFDIHARDYSTSIILKRDRTGYLVGEALLRTR